MRYLDSICDVLGIENNIKEIYAEEFIICFYKAIDDIDTVKENIRYMKDNHFEKYFVLDMVMTYPHQFNGRYLKDKLMKVKECFDTDFWFEYMYFEWDETGYSSIFELFDVLEIGYFEKHVLNICNKLKNIK